MLRALLLVSALLSAAPARAQSTATLRGVDVYRSSALTKALIEERFMPRIRQYVPLRNNRRPVPQQKAEALRKEIEAEAARHKGVAYAKLNVTEYFTSVDHALYLVFDVVDETDASRLAFTPAPKASLPDPDGLLAAWKQYVDAGARLSRRGEMPVERPSCPGFYCLWGGHPEVDSLQGRFSSGAAKQSEALRRVLRADADAEKRAAALFVLSYSASGPDVIALCNEALADSDSRVRGAALQILADIANHKPELAIPLERVLQRLDDPSMSERGKAMGLLVPLSDRAQYRQMMLSAAPRLVQLLRLSHPESRDLAFTVLGQLSKKSFDKRDVMAWESWAAHAALGKP